MGKFKAYDFRVKKISVVDKYLITCSTEGMISIWDIEEILTIKDNLENIFENYFALYDFKMETRLVHLSAYMFREEKKEKKQKKIKKIKKSN